MRRDADSDSQQLYASLSRQICGYANTVLVIPSDYSTQLTYLLRYPSPSSTSTSSIHPCTLLLRQALTLQMSPTAATCTSVVHENSNLLNVPIEVPEAPPPPTRRRQVNKNQTYSSSEAGPSRGPPTPDGNRMHFRHGSASMGIPEMIARGLLERGESLGINKTVMNAVSELKVCAHLFSDVDL